MHSPGGKLDSVKFCLAFQREALSVPITRRVLGDILHTVGVGDDSISDILLAATEACSNVLRHGAPHATGYAVILTIGANRCEVKVAEDWNPAGAGITADTLRRTAVSGGRRPSRPSCGLMMPGGTRRAGRGAYPPAPRRAAWRSGPASAPVPGRGDAPCPGRTASIASLPESGRGLDIIRACVDDVTLSSRPGRGTVVTMRKRIDWPGDIGLSQARAAS